MSQLITFFAAFICNYFIEEAMCIYLILWFWPNDCQIVFKECIASELIIFIDELYSECKVFIGYVFHITAFRFQIDLKVKVFFSNDVLNAFSIEKIVIPLGKIKKAKLIMKYPEAGTFLKKVCTFLKSLNEAFVISDINAFYNYCCVAMSSILMLIPCKYLSVANEIARFLALDLNNVAFFAFLSLSLIACRTIAFLSSIDCMRWRQKLK